jgi:SM-20-related protein
MSYLDFTALEQARAVTKPFEYVVVPDFITASQQSRAIENFPNIEHGGSYPLSSVDIPSPFQELLDELDSPAFEQAIERKFNVDLKGKPKLFSLRGICRNKDGKIHTDSKEKIITVLLYINERWTNQGGRLRLLKSDNLNDYVDEVAPDVGTLLIFRRSDNSFHGHEPFDGKRCSVQLNWLTTENRKLFQTVRHQISAIVKKFQTAGKAN